jgi:hypothetical protein
MTRAGLTSVSPTTDSFACFLRLSPHLPRFVRLTSPASAMFRDGRQSLRSALGTPPIRPFAPIVGRFLLPFARHFYCLPCPNHSVNRTCAKSRAGRLIQTLGP